jgi:hypothetical protein
MIVYTLKHDVYSWEENLTESFVEVFADEESAKNYFEIKKELAITEFLDYVGCADLEEYIQNCEGDYDEEPTIENLPYFYIWLDDYGSDKLVVQKKTVMSFE